MSESLDSEATALQRRIFRRMTPAQRWEQAVKLRHMTWEMTQNVFLHATT